MKFHGILLNFLLVITISIGYIKAEEDQSSPLEPFRRLIAGQMSRFSRLAPQMNQPVAEVANGHSERSYSSARVMDSINKGIASGYKKFKGAGSWAK